MSPVLSVEERARIAARYEVWQSVVQVQRWWKDENGRNATLDAKTIRRCHKKLLTTGSVVDLPRSGRPSTSRTEETIANVRDMFARSPKKSIRQASRESGLTRYTIETVLKEEVHFRSWNPHYIQQIFPEDYDSRMKFSEIMLRWKEDNPNLFNNIIWSEETVFYVGGFVNGHNCHYYAKTDSDSTVEKMQSHPKVTVWCGMTATNFVGPYLLRDTMNGVHYLTMLREFVLPTINQWDNSEELIFLQDGVSPNCTNEVREWLDTNFPGRWLGRRGPTEWPARSPDLTPCNFFLWGWATEEVYKTHPRTLDDLEDRIRDVLSAVPRHFLRSAAGDVPKRLQKCIDNAGAYVEL